METILIFAKNKLNLDLGAQNKCARLPDETIVPTYNEVVFACTVYLVHGRNHFVYSLPCGQRGYNCPFTSI